MFCWLPILHYYYVVLIHMFILTQVGLWEPCTQEPNHGWLSSGGRMHVKFWILIIALRVEGVHHCAQSTDSNWYMFVKHVSSPSRHHWLFVKQSLISTTFMLPGETFLLFKVLRIYCWDSWDVCETIQYTDAEIIWFKKLRLTKDERDDRVAKRYKNIGSS